MDVCSAQDLLSVCNLSDASCCSSFALHSDVYRVVEPALFVRTTRFVVPTGSATSIAHCEH